MNSQRSHPSRRSFLSSAAMLPAAAPAPSPVVRYGTLGKTGLKISRLVFGSMITSDAAVIERAYDLGINCFISARDYQKGNNERLLGAALKGKRDKVILSTESIDMMWRPKTEKETKQYVLENLETSLKELQTDYVDLFFLHHKDEPGWIPDEVAEAVRTAKRQGKIRHAGITTHALPRMVDYVLKDSLWEAVIPMYNFTMDAEMDAAVKKVHDAGVGVIAMKVMAGGMRDRNNTRMKRPGAYPAALKWALNKPGVDAVITSMTNIDQLEENVRAMAEPFTGSERQLLARTLNEIGTEFCRMCSRCEGTCVTGLPIAEIMRCGMYAEGYGQFSLGRSKFLEIPADVRARSCGECTTCSVKCPYHVRVAAHVSRTQELLA